MDLLLPWASFLRGCWAQLSPLSIEIPLFQRERFFSGSGSLQVSDNVSETDISNEAQNSRSSTDSAEEKLRNRLYELAMKMSEKETSSGEDQESESKTEPKNQKGSLSSEENNQGVQEELKKVRTKRCSAAAVCVNGGGGCRHALGLRKTPPQCSAQVLGGTFSVISADNQGRDPTVLGRCPIMSPVVPRL